MAAKNIISLLCFVRTLLPYFERSIHEMKAQLAGNHCLNHIKPFVLDKLFGPFFT